MKIEKYSYGENGPVIIFGSYEFKENETEKIIKTIHELCDEKEFTLVVLEADDWFDNFSIWRSDKLDEKFTGNAVNTLGWIKDNILSKDEFASREVIFMGYSLAGLFSIWAMLNTKECAGAICCSGSLWYPDFVEYLKENLPMNKRVYLSVGGKEANTKDELMATVIDKTKEVTDILKNSNTVKFELNSGGHFADVGKRLAKGIGWML